MSIGKLYKLSDNQFVAEVNYQFQDASSARWWGELSLTSYLRISEGEGYMLELEDNRKGACRLRKRVNRAVSGVPPRYIYQFTGTGPLEQLPE
ncbi:hypothetical protein ACFLXJ_02100 [Chloroflexota bacterium]